MNEQTNEKLNPTEQLELYLQDSTNKKIYSFLKEGVSDKDGYNFFQLLSHLLDKVNAFPEKQLRVWRYIKSFLAQYPSPFQILIIKSYILLLEDRIENPSSIKKYIIKNLSTLNPEDNTDVSENDLNAFKDVPLTLDRVIKEIANGFGIIAKKEQVIYYHLKDINKKLSELINATSELKQVDKPLELDQEYQKVISQIKLFNKLLPSPSIGEIEVQDTIQKKTVSPK